MPARAAGVVLLCEDGSALLQLRDDKPGLSAPANWVFPGGSCDDGESCADCARREFREETGYRCADLHPLTEFAYKCPDVARSFWLSFWWCAYDGVTPVHCFEGQAVRFVPREAAASLRIPRVSHERMGSRPRRGEEGFTASVIPRSFRAPFP